MGRLTNPQRRENQRLLVEVEKFKKTGDSLAFDAIAAALEGFLTAITKKFFFVAGSDAHDIHQEALIALATKAIPDYRREKGSFICFAKLCIRRHIITVLKSANSKKNEPLRDSVPLEQPVTSDKDEEGATSIGRFIPDTREESVVDQMVRKESFLGLKAMLCETLTPLETEILELYLKNLSYLDIVEAIRKRHRGRKKFKTKVVDNGLCRIKHKAAELREEMIKEAKGIDNGLSRIKKKAAGLRNALIREHGSGDPTDYI